MGTSMESHYPLTPNAAQATEPAAACGGSLVVAVLWWQSCGGSLVVAVLWWQSCGGCLVVEVLWWQCYGLWAM